MRSTFLARLCEESVERLEDDAAKDVRLERVAVLGEDGHQFPPESRVSYGGQPSSQLLDQQVAHWVRGHSDEEWPTRLLLGVAHRSHEVGQARHSTRNQSSGTDSKY